MQGLVVNRQAFRNLAALRDFILDNIHEFDELRGLAGITPEARLGRGRKLDLLATRRRRSQLVGIEPKLGEADDRAIGRASRSEITPLCRFR